MAAAGPGVEGIRYLVDNVPDGEAEHRPTVNLRRTLPPDHCPVYTEGERLGKIRETSFITLDALFSN